MKLTEWETVMAVRPDNLAFESGGSGLWSTLNDYLKFARLLLHDGEVDGVRLLRSEILASMVTNQLTDVQRANSILLGNRPFAAGRGFGLGVSVVLELELRHDAACQRGNGELAGDIRDLVAVRPKRRIGAYLSSAECGRHGADGKRHWLGSVERDRYIAEAGLQ